MNDPCKSCGNVRCLNYDLCECCGKCRNCGQAHTFAPMPTFIPFPVQPMPWTPPPYQPLPWWVGEVQITCNPGFDPNVKAIYGSTSE